MVKGGRMIKGKKGGIGGKKLGNDDGISEWIRKGYLVFFNVFFDEA